MSSLTSRALTTYIDLPRFIQYRSSASSITKYDLRSLMFPSQWLYEGHSKLGPRCRYFPADHLKDAFTRTFRSHHRFMAFPPQPFL